MAFAKASDGVKLYFEEAGTGTPIVFVHEFGGDHRSWELQMRHFSRRHRCITFAARGYPPSDVPESAEDYSQRRAAEDIVAVMDGARIDRAHVVGLSMGGFATLHLGLEHPKRALSLVVAGAGYGAEKQHEAYFREVSMEVARQFQNKDPRGWQEFATMLGEHSALGSANTMSGVQVHRPSLYDLEDRLKQMQVPTLVVVGDEDDHCLQPGIFLKKTVPACGLLVLPKTGHTLNLEEPDHFNHFVAEFVGMVEAGRWLPRDPRAMPQQIMKTS